MGKTEEYFSKQVNYTGYVENQLINATGYYDKDFKYRFRLSIDLDKEKHKVLTVIMLNPSEKSINKIEQKTLSVNFGEKRKTFVDGTITNVIKIAKHCNEYKNLIILNSFSAIISNGDDALKKYYDNKNSKYETQNRKYILDYLKTTNSDIMLAWGSKVPKELKNIYLQTLVGNKNLKYFAWSPEGFPYHPSPRNNRLNAIKTFFKTANTLQPMEVKTNDNKNYYLVQKLP